MDIVPGTNLQCVAFKLRLCPIRPPAAANGTCTVFPCVGTKCAIFGLRPGTTYNVTVVCVVAPPGNDTDSSSSSELTTPPELPLIAANATSPTTGTAVADPKPNDAFVKVSAASQARYIGFVPRGSGAPLGHHGRALLQFTFTVVEAGCTSNCSALVFNNTEPRVNITGLTPWTTVSATRCGVPMAMDLRGKRFGLRQ